jgi:hypothetical protein
VAQDGGGVWASRSSYYTITNCTIVGNRAKNLGGGVLGNAVITNCTIVGNRAENLGGGVLGGNATITNCILWDNAVLLSRGIGIQMEFG